MAIVLKKTTTHKPFATFFIAGYICELVNETVRVCDRGHSMPLYTQQLSQPHSLSSCYEKPDKISAIVRHRSIFSSEADKYDLCVHSIPYICGYLNPA